MIEKKNYQTWGQIAKACWRAAKIHQNWNVCTLNNYSPPPNKALSVRLEYIIADNQRSKPKVDRNEITLSVVIGTSSINVNIINVKFLPVDRIVNIDN